MFTRQIRSLVFFIFVWALVLGIGRSFAGVIAFGPRETKIEGAIKYTVIGRYAAHFNDFKGRIVLDERSGRIQSVYLEIQAASIQSNHPWYDKLARSRRLLNARRYPKIIFKSDQVIQDAGGYKVKGVLEMHGIKRRMIFPFEVAWEDQGKILDLRGSWNVDRKDFNIIWNKYLDRGGVLVSDIFTVNWGIKVLMPDTHSSSS